MIGDFIFELRKGEALILQSIGCGFDPCERLTLFVPKALYSNASFPKTFSFLKFFYLNFLSEGKAMLIQQHLNPSGLIAILVFINFMRVNLSMLKLLPATV